MNACRQTHPITSSHAPKTAGTFRRLAPTGLIAVLELPISGDPCIGFLPKMAGYFADTTEFATEDDCLSDAK